jgi:geranylgeranyl reductase family protein
MPPTTDVLVIGAGPAGSAAARRLALGGLRVVLVDRFVFPRDKVCGDAIIPDALESIGALGLDPAVRAAARFLEGVTVFAPDGTAVAIDGECACLPRARLDRILQQAAIDAGASFRAPFTLVAWQNGDGSATATFKSRASDGQVVEIRPRVTILATGAGIEGITRTGVVERREPSAVALRGYFQVPPEISGAYRHLCISYDRHVLPGYGWIFPGPDDVFNLGVGWFLDSRTPPPTSSLAALWRAFTTRFEPARRLVEASRQLGAMKGAPLRTALRGTELHRPGLLVVGEAAGTTYSFSGEGIGKAMATGLVAADVVLEHARRSQPLDSTGPEYEARVRGRFGEQFAAYASAQRWLERPWVANLIAARARRSAFAARQLHRMFTETTDPRALFSVGGLLRTLVS